MVLLFAMQQTVKTVKSITEYMSNQPHEGGRFGEIYTEGDFLSAIESLQPAGTREIANTVGCSRQNADYRLREFAEENKVSAKKIGNSLVWTRSEEKI